MSPKPFIVKATVDTMSVIRSREHDELKHIQKRLYQLT